MIGCGGVLAAVLIAASSVSTQDRTSPGDQAFEPSPSVITKLRWSAPPAVEFPAAAMSRGITRGRAGVDCAVAPDGRLTDCRIILDQPQGLGFGEAVMKAAAEARLHPESTANAAPDARVRFSADFILQ